VKHKIEKVFEEKLQPYKDSSFLIAVSGGVDSMVLASLFKTHNLKFSVAHCNFKLRADESDADELFVANWSKENNQKYFNASFNTLEYCKNNKVGTQEGARNLRYKWFYDLKEIYGFDFIVTAHNLNDQIETYLINSMRGTGLRGLVGIPEKTDKLFRPLLDISKNEINEYAINNNIEFREDSSNSSNDYLRNTIRNSIIPKFEEFDDNVMLKFRTTINNLNSTKIFADIIISDTKEKIFLKEGINERIKISDLSNLNPLDFYVHSFFSEYGFDYKEVIKLFTSDSGKYIDSTKYKLTKNKNDLIITKND
jgi:tRNA(Ile)-lysidine synthase